MSQPGTVTISEKASTLGEAVINAGSKLGLSADQVGEIIGRNRTTITRNGIEPASLQGQMALLLVRLYRGLYALVGGDSTKMVHWMNSKIKSLDDVPSNMIKNVSGLVRVVEYIDGIRAKV